MKIYTGMEQAESPTVHIDFCVTSCVVHQS